MSKVSVIMPVYNVEKYIAGSIKSVLSQTYSDFELLIVDDGSPDKSIDIAKSFSDDRILILQKPNGGLSDARNFGAIHATGEYIYFIDSDDWIEQNLLELSIDAIKKYDSDFVIFGYFLDKVDNKSNLISKRIISSSERLYKKEEKYFELNGEMLNLLGYAWNKLYKTEFLKNNKLIFDKGISLVEDILFNCKVYEHSEKILFINTPLYHYIDRPNTSLIKIFHKNSFDLIIMKNIALRNFFNTWNINIDTKNLMLAENINQGIRYCINNLFAFKNNLSEKEKLDYIKMIINHSETQKYIRYYKAVSIYDKLYKTMISAQTSLLLYLLCKIKK